MPTTAVGLGWPYLLTPLAAIFGPDMANGLPAVIALNVVVLAPAAVIGMYLLGERIAGTVLRALDGIRLGRAAGGRPRALPATRRVRP